MAKGDELLIVDSRDSDRDGMRKLFEGLGYSVSAVDTASAARDLVARKLFHVALVDLDVEHEGAGIELLRSIRSQSRATALVMLTTRRSFELVVEALRIGVHDVVLKHPDHVASLREIVAAAVDRVRADSGDGGVLVETVAVLDEAFRIMLDMGRRQHADASTRAPQTFRPRVLVVDGREDFLRELAPLLQSKAWEVAAEMNGGSALDKAGTHRFELVVARAELMDLRGSMVIKTIQADRPETVGVVYSAEGGGRLTVSRVGQADEVDRPFLGAVQLTKKLESIVEALSVTERDRRAIQAFRAANEKFFRRYAELKRRL